jgi:uncharacterized membrane protein YhaH (DUF805 family)
MTNVQPISNDNQRCFAAIRLQNFIDKYSPEGEYPGPYIANLPLDAALISDIRECICSNEPDDIFLGLFFVQNLIDKKPLHEFGFEFEEFFLSKILEFVQTQKDRDVLYLAIEFFIFFDLSFDCYRQIMLNFLKSEDDHCKLRALEFYTTYAEDYEIEPLLSFETNDIIFQNKFDGEFSYRLRNLALEQLGKVTGQNFLDKKIAAINFKEKKNVVSYDWSKFLEWRKKNYRPKLLFIKKHFSPQLDLLNFTSRLARVKFIGLLSFWLSILLMGCNLIELEAERNIYLHFTGFTFIIIAVAYMLNIIHRRIKDMGRPTWELFCFLIPYYNMWLLFECLFEKGTGGINRYGIAPKAPTIFNSLLIGCFFITYEVFNVLIPILVKW